MQSLTPQQKVEIKEREQFIQHALASRACFLQTGLAFDGNEFANYLKAKVRGLDIPERPSLSSKTS